jgi:tetratricopeptide (TPR) repeat protein
VKRAIALEEQNDWEGLFNWCLEWTEREPKNAKAWFFLGNAHNNRNAYDSLRRDKVIAAYRQALQIDPDYAAAWNSLRDAYYNLKRYDDAIETYSE